MLKNKGLLKVVCALLSVVICVISFGNYSPIKTNAADYESLENRYSQLEKELNQLKKDMTSTQNKKNEQLKYKNQLDKQITLVEEQIANLNSQITLLNKEIAENQKLLSEKEDEISQNDELYKARLRSMYMAGDASVWEVIFKSQSFSDFMRNTEYMKRLAENDKKLMQKLNTDKNSIVEAKQKIETNKLKVEANQQTMVSKKSSLDSQYKQSQQLLNTLTKEENSLKQQQIQINKEMEKIDAEIEEMLRENGVNGDYAGGKLKWPVPNYKTITSRFGWRTLYGQKNWHTGIDISGANIYGKNIVAANGGTVIKVVHTYVAKKGYGKYLIIDHGGGYTTLYAHCSSISVKVGQTVKRGDVIAQIGSTGNSTGPHLHFGVYINGTNVDPLNYL